MVKGEFLAWLTGAADRAGLSAPPDERLPPLEDGDDVVGKCSPAALRLFACAVALSEEIKAKLKEVTDSDSHSQLQAFHEEYRLFLKPGLDILKDLAEREMRFGIGECFEKEDSYCALMLMQGGNVVGFKDKDLVLPRIARLFQEEM